MLIGTMVAMRTKRKMLANILPIHGAFLICMVIFGNGALIGTNPYGSETQIDPSGAISSSNRVARGGSFVNNAANQRSASRNYWIFDGTS